MKTKLLVLLFILVSAGISSAQEINGLKDFRYSPNNLTTKSFSDNLFYGGEFGASFGSYSQITIAPTIGYKFNNMFATILKVGYSRGWSSDYKDQGGSTLGYDNFGASITARFSPVRQFYAMLEPAYYSYEAPIAYYSGNTLLYYGKERRSVPFIFLGAGLYQALPNSRVGLTAEIKVDLLNDKNSPYKEWSPMYSVGVSFGF